MPAPKGKTEKRKRLRRGFEGRRGSRRRKGAEGVFLSFPFGGNFGLLWFVFFERDENVVKTRFHIYRLGLAAGIARGHK